MSVVIKNIPEKMRIQGKTIDFDVFVEKLIEYIEDLEDLEKVKKEMKTDEESFDYSSIRGNYV